MVLKFKQGGTTSEITDKAAKQTAELTKKAVDSKKAVKNAMKEKEDEFVSKKKTNYVKNGVLITLGTELVLQIGNIAKYTTTNGISQAIKVLTYQLSDKGFLKLFATGLAIEALIGAGIGKIVEKVKSKKQAE